jgi:hypothetical protein
LIAEKFDTSLPPRTPLVFRTWHPA